MKEKSVMLAAAAVTALILVLVFAILSGTPEISRIPIQEVYTQGMVLNYYVNILMPIVIVSAILFIAGLSTFGLYHGATRELLGKKPLVQRSLGYIRRW
jgi:hypothetical protein